MADMFCAKCGEPWDAWGVNNHTDMSVIEAERFKRGEGCPHCQFGTACTSCDGTGTTRQNKSAPDYCPTCHGSGQVLVRKLYRPQQGNKYNNWSFGYAPDKIREGPEPFRILRSETSLDGGVKVGWSWCPDCKNAGPKCSQCAGTGKFNKEAEGDHLEKALCALVESTDEDPLIYLSEYDLT